MNEEKTPLEIERKFLIRYPEQQLLQEHSAGRIDIEQIYLADGPRGESRRLRRSRRDGEETLYYTEKLHITSVTRIERERVITPAEYGELAQEKDPDRNVIAKTRWLVPYGGHTLEIDVFPFWNDRAYCECELGSEQEELLLPDWLRVIREVTDDRRYTNKGLAREIPFEPLPEEPQS